MEKCFIIFNPYEMTTEQFEDLMKFLEIWQTAAKNEKNAPKP